MSDKTLAAPLVERFAATAAMQMREQAQGYTSLNDYGQTVELSWYSDTPNQFICELAIDGKSRAIEVSDDADGLEAALSAELSA